MDGVVLVDKPKGLSSFEVIKKLRKKFETPKVGHAGTLDPNATGLLLVGVGKGTKELSTLVGLPKTYEAEIRLGVRTDTGDSTGAVVEKHELIHVTKDSARAILMEMKGTLLLAVPAYSATKQGGVPLYKKARRGEGLVIPFREMEIHEAELLEIEGELVRVRFNVGSGTYIRSLAEEFGKRLGTVATLENLRRTRIGTFRVEEAEGI